jgi:HK97 family phage prohead protease/HK97 family phage major capsid protein
MRYSEKAAPAPGGEPDEFVMSDGSVDRMGDVIEPSGWDLTAIKSDPVVLFNHDRGQVVGSWKDIRVKDGKLIGRINWTKSKEWPMGNYIRDLVREGILRTVSVGFKPHEKRPLTKDASPEYGPFRFTKQSLLECSLVSVPANANALAIAKDYPRGLLDEVFRKPASEHLDRSAAPHGKSAASPIEQQKGSKMSNAATIANKIQSAQQSLNGLLASYEELAGRSEMGEDETKRYRDELPAQIDAAKAELESHKRAERILLGGQTASDPMPAALTGQIMAPTPAKSDQSIGEVVRIPAVPKKKLEPSDHQFRALAAWTKSQASHEQDIGQTLRTMYGTNSMNEITGMVLRAAVNPANTTIATWAAELIQTDVMPFMDRLIADSIYLQLANMGVRYTFGNAGILKIPVRANTPTLAGNWTAEGGAKPVKRASFTTVSLSPTKMSVISTFTEEMATYSAQSIEQIIRQAMSDDTQMALDGYLIDAVAFSAGVRPAGLLAGVTPITASALTPATAAMVADLKALIGAIVASGGGRNIAIIINPAQALSLGFAQTTTGDFLFTDRTEAGSKFGVRFIVSASCPAGRVIAVDAADFATANGDSPRFAVSTDATLHEEDTNPLALGTGTQGAGVLAVPMRSLFQTDAVAVRMSLYVSWVMRRTGMVQTIASVSW